MNIENIIADGVINAVQSLYNQTIDSKLVQVQETKKEFVGDATVVVFPLLKISKKSPDVTAQEIGLFLKENVAEVDGFNVIKGFLNIEVAASFWHRLFLGACQDERFGFVPVSSTSKKVMIEYSSPNTNKPLHLGHIRNNLLGYSVANLLIANGYQVTKVNLVNNRGIHICKSMLAWKLWGNNETPESSGMKGDHLVGKYYVLFSNHLKAQVKELIASGVKEDLAEKQAPLMLEAQEMLRKWEAGDADVHGLWNMMNSWVYAGFDETYRKLGVDFDKIYYESDTYLSGKETILEALKDGVCYQEEDSSVWIDMTNDGLDKKVLLRKDGTSVYMTQDIGTAQIRQKEFGFEKLVYVVGNEQDYHFKALFTILKKMKFPWSNDLYHLSYGMVELPEGKMKSREGTVVDADDLIDEMVDTARDTSKELGKLDGLSEEEAHKVFHTIALGALKYFILKVDPKKSMTFNPKESIDFNGNTGPFIQYTYARIQSVLRKAADAGLKPDNTPPLISFNRKEINLLILLAKFPQIVKDAGDAHSPALVANYTYDLAKEFNQFYHDYSIMNEPDEAVKAFRLTLAANVAKVLKNSFWLLGIDVPERM